MTKVSTRTAIVTGASRGIGSLEVALAVSNQDRTSKCDAPIPGSLLKQAGSGLPAVARCVRSMRTIIYCIDSCAFSVQGFNEPAGDLPEHAPGQ